MTDTIDNIRRKILSLYNQKSDPAELGTVALEIILKRNEVRNELEHNPTFEKKHKIERTIDELHELERVIVSLYMLQGKQSTSSKQQFHISDYTKAKYQLFNKKIIP